MGPQIDYRAVLQDLEARRLELDVAIQAIRKIAGVVTEPVPTPTTHRHSPLPGGFDYTPNLPERIESLFEANSSSIFTIEDVSRELSVDEKSTRNALSRMANTGRVMKLSRGRYAFKSFQPNQAENLPLGDASQDGPGVEPV